MAGRYGQEGTQPEEVVGPDLVEEGAGGTREDNRVGLVHGAAVGMVLPAVRRGATEGDQADAAADEGRRRHREVNSHLMAEQELGEAVGHCEG